MRPITPERARALLAAPLDYAAGVDLEPYRRVTVLPDRSLLVVIACVDR